VKTPGCTLIGLGHDTRPKGQYGVTTPGQIMKNLVDSDFSWI
jgi:hypothetical protein